MEWTMKSVSGRLESLHVASGLLWLVAVAAAAESTTRSSQSDVLARRGACLARELSASFLLRLQHRDARRKHRHVRRSTVNISARREVSYSCDRTRTTERTIDCTTPRERIKQQDLQVAYRETTVLDASVKQVTELIGSSSSTLTTL